MLSATLVTRTRPDSSAASSSPTTAAQTARADIFDVDEPAPMVEPVPTGDVAIAPPPEAFDGPAATAPPPAPLASRGRFADVVPSGGTWAVMIGVNDYPGTRHDLRSAVADVGDVNEALARMGVTGDRRLVVTNGQATVGTIKLAAEWLVAHAGPDAVAVFFYAGHVRKVSGSTEAILAADGKMLSDADLAAALRPLRARRAWVGIAACYAGGFTEVLAPGRVLTGAAPANKLAYENTSFGRSYMVQYMIRHAMLDNRAPESVQASFDYARVAISRDFPGREPVQFDHGGGPLSLRPPAAAAAASPQRSPAPAASPQSPPPGGAGSAGGSAGGSSGGSSSPPPKDCKGVQLGVVRCKD